MPKQNSNNAQNYAEEKPLSTLRFISSSMTSSESSSLLQDDSEPLVSFVASPKGPKCPFGNNQVKFELYPGGCVWLAGRSGLGKTTLSTYLAGLSTLQDLETLDIDCQKCDWNSKIHPSERCGILFQQTTLLDALTIAGNISVALQSCPSAAGKYPTPESQIPKIKQIMEAVGLNYARDASKRPTELSGGMARRASLALQLAQKKRVITLDEPFTGLDWETSKSVCKQILRMRKDLNASILLITHEPDLAQIVMDKDNTQHNYVVELQTPTKDPSHQNGATSNALSTNNLLFGITFRDRFLEKLYDYVLYSLPLIVMTFLACGLAIAMLSADILQRIDVTDQVVGIVEQEIKPLIKMVTGEEEANPMYLMVAKMKVRSMLNTAVPEAKAKLYAIGMAKLFVLEIGPLITALLLSGRIGGSYAGKVATMQATSQTKLLRTLGINPQSWTFFPAIAAALLASPLLTVIGTSIALFLGCLVGPRYGIGSYEGYQEELYSAVLPDLDVQTALKKSWFSALVELTTYPPVFHLWKATTFIGLILLVAEAAARMKPNLSPRGVPGVITSSVVIASLLVIIADWAFSQWLILRV